MIKVASLFIVVLFFSHASAEERIPVNNKTKEQPKPKERLILKPIANKIIQPTAQTRIIKPFSVEYKKKSNFSK